MNNALKYRLMPALLACILAIALVPVFAAQDGVRPSRQPDVGQHNRFEPAQVEAVSVLILSGQNNHDWVRTTPMLEDILGDAGRFEVTVSDAPANGADAAAWEGWRPAFADYDVVLSNYNGQMWPDEVKAAFVTYIEDGGKALLLHAANNAFTGWEEYELMTGLLWRNADYGDRLFYNSDGELVRQEAGEGPGASHGPVHDWSITHREEHPIFEDLPTTWLHAADELYHGQRGPAQDMTILATAYSAEDKRGTGQHEPQIWTIPYGDGTVMTFLPGHLWNGQQDIRAFRCVGFQTLLNRSCEWLGSGEVTLEAPDNFPGEDELSVVE